MTRLGPVDEDKREQRDWFDQNVLYTWMKLAESRFFLNKLTFKSVD